MDKMLSVYMTYGGKTDTCSMFATVCPNLFEIYPIRVVYGRNNLNLVECSYTCRKFYGLVVRDFIISTCTIVAKRSLNLSGNRRPNSYID